MQILLFCKIYFNNYKTIKVRSQMIKLEKVEILQTQQPDMIRNFSNPVCKQTFYSLPRIYGKKKKLGKQESSSQKQIKKKESQSAVKPTRIRSSFQLSSNSKEKRRISQSRLLNIAHTSGCTKQNCQCHKIQQNIAQKTRKKFITNYTRQITLPQIRKFELEDLESQHKVLLQGAMTKTNFGKTGLDSIIEENQKLKSATDTPKIFKKEQVQKPRTQSPTINPISKHNLSNISNIKNKYKVKPKIKFQIEEESDEEKITDENQQERQEMENKKKYQRRQSARYKTQVNDSESPKSINSISLSSLLFRGTKRQNTNFYDLNLSQKSMEKKKLSRKPSQLSNGLFRIPQQQQYADYLKGYRSVNQNFEIKKIAKRATFKVQKSQKGVYFGQFDDQMRKHGEGINVTDKQIFQGRYERNIKTSGCERNIDGVYIGQFKNGVRQGHGVFRWNNGQIFQGKWENGTKNGYGVWKSPKGDCYEGEWVQNRQHGQGVFKHRTSIYKGSFKNFLKDGYGSEEFMNGDSYEGEYKEGKPHGKGRYKWHKGGYYEGQFVQGMREGRGKWVDQNKTIYEGYFKSDFKHGFGKQIYSSGERFQGLFQEGTRSDGKLYDKNNNFIQVGEKKGR